MPVNVIVEVGGTGTLVNSASVVAGLGGFESGDADSAATALNNLPGFTLDSTYAPVPVPAPTPLAQDGLGSIKTNLGLASTGVTITHSSSYIVRGTLKNETDANIVLDQPGVRGVYSDPQIAHFMTCIDTAAVGTDADVARLLGTDRLAAAGMDGSGVYIAVVDTGINLAYLNKKGKNPKVDIEKSWVSKSATFTPFEAPLNHGTMCAYDTLIAAPKATLIDLAVLVTSPALPGGSPISGLLSDAVLAYRQLLDILIAARQRGEKFSLIITNSWGIYDPDWDFPPGHPLNYTDNPQHAFNRIVGTLERYGADILFAAGNCGKECKDQRCNWADKSSIVGANSHPGVLCVAGVDVKGERVGYSSVGPGRLVDAKPDISGFTHFRGSDAFGAGVPDSGTSAACPVVAGVVAALRSRLPSTDGAGSGSPSALRRLIRETALDRGAPGFDYEYGNGIINGPALAKRVATLDIADPTVTAAVANLDAELRGVPALKTISKDSADSDLAQLKKRIAARSSARVTTSPDLTADASGVKTIIMRVVTGEPMKTCFVDTFPSTGGSNLVPPGSQNIRDCEGEFKTSSTGRLTWAVDLETTFKSIYQIFLTEKGQTQGQPVESGVTDTNGQPTDPPSGTKDF